MGFFDKIKAGLAKTRDALSNTLGSVFSGFSQLDDDFYDELEESLILADLGVETATKATERLRKVIKEEHLKTPEEAKTALKNILVEMLNVGDVALNLSTTPSVILVIGVNGVGKTTTIGKIATQLVKQGKRFCWWPVIPSAPLRRISWKCGQAEAVPTLSASMKARTLLPWYTMGFRLPAPGMWT